MRLTGLSISPRHVQQLTDEVGAELARQRDAQAQQHRRRQLKPRVGQTPAAVVVEVDGGRLRTRATGAGRGVHQAENQEDKIACLVTPDRVEHSVYPQPQPPASFLQPRRVQRLVQQMAGQVGRPRRDNPAAAGQPASPDHAAVEPPSGGAIEDEPWAPKRRARTCVARRAEGRSFGPMVAGAAQARDFDAAGRRAFVADGLAYNWSIQEGYFPDFEPIVDLLHVLCYLYKAAYGQGADEGPLWSRYEGWLWQWWQGQVSEVVADVARQGRPALCWTRRCTRRGRGQRAGGEGVRRPSSGGGEGGTGVPLAVV